MPGFRFCCLIYIQFPIILKGPPFQRLVLINLLACYNTVIPSGL
jgi:hypothetical protein